MGSGPSGMPTRRWMIYRLHLRMGKFQVIDADISKYFDTIPHDQLLEQVARRIVDKNILKLIRMWLKAPVVEEGEDGKKRYLGNDQGTPQGGVISPLLANIYLNVLDTVWKTKKSPGERWRPGSSDMRTTLWSYARGIRRGC